MGTARAQHWSTLMRTITRIDEQSVKNVLKSGGNRPGCKTGRPVARIDHAHIGHGVIDVRGEGRAVQYRVAKRGQLREVTRGLAGHTFSAFSRCGVDVKTMVDLRQDGIEYLHRPGEAQFPADIGHRQWEAQPGVDVARATSATASSALAVNGFSYSTCLPACSAAMARTCTPSSTRAGSLAVRR